MKRPDNEEPRKILSAAERRAIVAKAHRDHFGESGTMTRMALCVMPSWIDELAASHELLEEENARLKAILRDWLDACPETCGQCEAVRERAEEAVK